MNGKNELVSIIVPVYNVEKYLERCIVSIVQQTYENIEIILVDDGSTDRSSEICDDWCRRDKRIKVIHRENGGLSAARNSGIDQATGEYFSFIDSDDYVSQYFIEKLVKLLRDNNTRISICNLTYIYEEDNSERVANVPNGCRTGRKIILEEMEKGIYYGQVMTKLYHKSIFEQLRFPEKRIHEDDFVFHKIFWPLEKVSSTSEGLYYYVQRSGSIMQNVMTVKRLNDWIDSRKERYEFFCEQNDVELLRCTANCYLATIFMAYMRYMDFLPKDKQQALLKEYISVIKNLKNSKAGNRREIVNYRFKYWKIKKMVKNLKRKYT